MYPIEYSMAELQIWQTEVFSLWIKKLRDPQARARINVRIRRLSLGNAGDVKPIGSGVSEMRIDYGPGYRVYYAKRGTQFIVLLAGGDKTTQQDDIKMAINLAEEL
jgi:putative addiction module killer protein